MISGPWQPVICSDAVCIVPGTMCCLSAEAFLCHKGMLCGCERSTLHIWCVHLPVLPVVEQTDADKLHVCRHSQRACSPRF